MNRISPIFKKQAEDGKYFKQSKKISSEKMEENNWQRMEKREENRKLFERAFGRGEVIQIRREG